MGKEEVVLVVSYKINDFELFQAIAAECAHYVSSHEEGTLAYDWYVADDKANGKLYEAYQSPDALEAHLLGAVFKIIGPKFKQSITWVSIESFGPLPNVYDNILGALPNINWASPAIGVRK